MTTQLEHPTDFLPGRDRDRALLPDATRVDLDVRAGNPRDPLQPRPHQVDALTDLTTALAAHDRTQLIMACGSGKTLVGRWHTQAVDAHTVLVLVPSLALVAQTMQEWRRVNTIGWHYRSLVVCSDPTTAEGIDERGDDSLELDDSIWDHMSTQVTTDSAAVRRFLIRDTNHRKVIFATYHSSPVIAAAQTATEHAFDLVICDEAHRLAGAPRESFTTVLDSRKIVARKRLFMTATPRTFEAADQISMSDPSLFGPVAHTVTFGDAIAAGFLTDYQVVVVANRVESIGAEAIANTSAAALHDAIDRYQLTRILSFHGRVAKAAGFARAIDDTRTTAGKTLHGRHVSGSMPTDARIANLQWLRGTGDDVRIVSNARCLTEGVDIPSVDAILFADQRKNPIDILQAIGRVLRPSPGKTVGTIILPVSVPPDVDDETLLATSEFAHVWMVLRGLRAHDQRLADEVDQAVNERTRNPHSHPHLGRVTFVGDFNLTELDLQTRLITEVGTLWERNYALLQQWAEDHPGKIMARGLLIPRDGGKIPLGEWAEQQRIAHRRGTLPTERAERLATVPGWTWDKVEARWWKSYDITTAYAAEHGTIADHTTGESRFKGIKAENMPRRALGVWMAEQRQAYRLGTLPADKITALEKLPGWAWDADLPQVDVDMVEALRVFVEFEKHAHVPDDHLEDGLRLGAWCWAIRRRRHTDHLAPALLDEILAASPSQDIVAGRFQWETTETKWRIGYFALRQFAAREGHCRPTLKDAREVLPDTTVGIAAWVAQQRFRHRHGEMPERQAKLLEQLNGWEWEIDLKQVVTFGEPVDLTGHVTDHGRPGAYGKPHFCRCEVCIVAKRESQRIHARRKGARLVDPVPADAVRDHLTVLETQHATAEKGPVARNGRVLIAALSRVSLGQIRKIIAGTATELERAHADAILAITFEDLVAARNTEGSRGRSTSDLTAKVDTGPTFELLDDLAARGLGPSWVGRELGYLGAPQLRRNGRMQKRLADAIADLYARAEGIDMSHLYKQVRRPPLAELLTAKSKENA